MNLTATTYKQNQNPPGSRYTAIPPSAVGCNPSSSSFSLGGLASLDPSPYSRFIEGPPGKHCATYFYKG